MKIRNRQFVRLGAFLFTQLCRAIFLTVRIERHHNSGTPFQGSLSARPEDSCTQRFIFSIWHDSVIGPLFGGTTDRLAVLTSRHSDGAFVTHVLQAMGIAAVRGSTSRGGASALREMVRTAHATHLAMTPDGPRGPRRQMSRGIVYLASRTGSAIVPIGVAYSQCWKIRGSWTELAIPRPFTRVAMMTGELLQVPEDAQEETLDHYVRRLQDAMDQLTEEAHRQLELRPRRVLSPIVDRAA